MHQKRTKFEMQPERQSDNFRNHTKNYDNGSPLEEQRTNDSDTVSGEPISTDGQFERNDGQGEHDMRVLKCPWITDK